MSYTVDAEANLLAGTIVYSLYPVSPPPEIVFEIPNYIVRAIEIIGKENKVSAIKLARGYYGERTNKTLGLLEGKLLVEKIIENWDINNPNSTNCLHPFQQ